MLVRHFKGGLYRRLFDATLVPADFDSVGRRDSIMDSVFHTDDRRVLRVGIDWYEGGATDMTLIDDRTIDEDRADIDSPERPYWKPHVVYVSLRYGSVWARPKDEFEGTTNLRASKDAPEAGEDALIVPRFAPVFNPESLDVFAENQRLGFENAIDQALQACRDVEQRYERLRKGSAISYAGEQILGAGSYAADECVMAVAALMVERGKKK